RAETESPFPAARCVISPSSLQPAWPAGARFSPIRVSSVCAAASSSVPRQRSARTGCRRQCLSWWISACFSSLPLKVQLTSHAGGHVQSPLRLVRAGIRTHPESAVPLREQIPADHFTGLDGGRLFIYRIVRYAPARLPRRITNVTAGPPFSDRLLLLPL